MWRSLLGVGALLAVGASVATHGSRDTGETGHYGAVGTSGSLDDQSVIHELETITGMNDAHAFVGRRVDLGVPVQQYVNDVAFWVGSSDNRLLVVLAHGARDGAARQKGPPSNDGTSAESDGQVAAISGTVRNLPTTDILDDWGLAEADRADLLDRRVYIRAETVIPHLDAGKTSQR